MPLNVSSAVPPLPGFVIFGDPLLDRYMTVLSLQRTLDRSTGSVTSRKRFPLLLAAERARVRWFVITLSSDGTTFPKWRLTNASFWSVSTAAQVSDLHTPWVPWCLFDWTTFICFSTIQLCRLSSIHPHPLTLSHVGVSRSAPYHWLMFVERWIFNWLPRCILWNVVNVMGIFVRISQLNYDARNSGTSLGECTHWLIR